MPDPACHHSVLRALKFSQPRKSIPVVSLRTDSLDEWIQDQLNHRANADLIRRRRVFRGFPGGWCEVDGQGLRNFAGNDYLGLAHHPAVIKAACEAVQLYGAGGRGSPLVCGRTPLHAELEQSLAKLEGEEAAILFPSGLAANMGTLGALIQPEDLVFCDRWNHASLIDGCRLSGAQFRVYRHDDLPRLEQALQRSSQERRRWIVTDTVFSMDGDLAPLPELCDLAEKYEAHVIVDEAHATGVFGLQGRGVCEVMGVQERVAVRIGTLSKALGSQGGFVAGSKGLIDFLWHAARTQVYSTALSPAACGAALASIRSIRQEPDRRAELWNRCTLFRQELGRQGLQAMPHSTGPITPILLEDPARTVAIARQLEQQGFLVGAIRPPTVPQGTSRLRVSITVDHDRETLCHLAKAIAIAVLNDEGRGD